MMSAHHSFIFNAQIVFGSANMTENAKRRRGTFISSSSHLHIRKRREKPELNQWSALRESITAPSSGPAILDK